MFLCFFTWIKWLNYIISLQSSSPSSAHERIFLILVFWSWDASKRCKTSELMVWNRETLAYQPKSPKRVLKTQVLKFSLLLSKLDDLKAACKTLKCIVLTIECHPLFFLCSIFLQFGARILPSFFVFFFGLIYISTISVQLWSLQIQLVQVVIVKNPLQIFSVKIWNL